MGDEKNKGSLEYGYSKNPEEHDYFFIKWRVRTKQFGNTIKHPAQKRQARQDAPKHKPDFRDGRVYRHRFIQVSVLVISVFGSPWRENPLKKISVALRPFALTGSIGPSPCYLLLYGRKAG
jgi:hypothetical protein